MISLVYSNCSFCWEIWIPAIYLLSRVSYFRMCHSFRQDRIFISRVFLLQTYLNASRRVVNWVEEVDCVTLIREDRRVVVLAFWNQPKIAHHGWIDASCSSRSIKDFGQLPSVSSPKIIWFSVQTLAVVG